MNIPFWLLILIIAAVVGNIIIRRILRKVDEYEPSKMQIDDDSIPQTTDYYKFDINELLSNWGIADRGYKVPESYLPLHESFIELISNYKEVAFDPNIKIFNRNLITSPFSENSNFIQIGNWGDGSETLIRLNSDDPKVYWADIEDGTPERPAVLAQSINEYFFLSKKDYDSSEEIMKRKGIRLDKNRKLG